MKYRPEIDGLRAIAVMAVVLFHAGIGRAGFFGVDVFFVISGYLITALLLKGMGLRTFYLRRIRRIVPAVTVLIVVVAVVSPLIQSGETLRLTEQSAVASAVFAANVFFENVRMGNADPPLLHLWTLAVEEQFYLVWPLLLMLIPRRYLVPALVALALASLGLAWWLTRLDSTAAFFQMPARFWEFAAGGIIAALPQRRLPALILPVGIALTIFACIIPLGSLPGPATLPPVLGACMVLAAIHGGATNALLASRPFVGLGLISYSLYLWHWPLVAFYGGDNMGIQLALFAAALVLSMLSCRFVERPFRHAGYRLGENA